MNNDKLYEMIKAIRKYATSLVYMNPSEAMKLDSSYWQAYVFDIALSLTIIEEFIKNGKDE